MKIRTLFVVALAALTLAACALGRVAYNNAGPVLTWMADDYFDLSGGQEEWFRDRLGKAVAWHRRTELPHYDKFLREALVRTERPITIEDARWMNTNLRTYYHRMVERLVPDGAEFLAQLEPDQALRFEQRFGEDNAKIVREQMSGDPDVRKERRTKKMITQIESYTGSLTPEQRNLVAGRVHFMADVTQMRLEDRKLRQARVVEIVRSKPPRAQLEAQLKRLFIDTDSWRKPDYVARMKQRDEQVFELAVALAATLSPEQRENVRSKLRSYLNDVSSLMASR